MRERAREAGRGEKRGGSLLLQVLTNESQENNGQPPTDNAAGCVLCTFNAHTHVHTDTQRRDLMPINTN